MDRHQPFYKQSRGLLSSRHLISPTEHRAELGDPFPTSPIKILHPENTNQSYYLCRYLCNVTLPRGTPKLASNAAERKEESSLPYTKTASARTRGKRENKREKKKRGGGDDKVYK